MDRNGERKVSRMEWSTYEVNAQCSSRRENLSRFVNADPRSVDEAEGYRDGGRGRV